jgi:hypothetical protein
MLSGWIGKHLLGFVFSVSTVGGAAFQWYQYKFNTSPEFIAYSIACGLGVSLVPTVLVWWHRKPQPKPDQQEKSN